MPLLPISPPHVFNMQIDKDTAVTLSVRVADSKGQLIDEGKHPTAYLHGGYDNIFPKVEAALQGKTRGDQVSLELSAEDAFGLRDESLVCSIPKAEFPPGVKVGGQLQRRGDDGEEHVYNVVKIKGPVVLLDGNHPMAGIGLRLTIKVLEVRAASAEEIAHKHVHGAHGHHH